MASSATRIEIVMRATKLAGRGAEIYPLAKEFLNDILRSWAMESKFPLLRKVGSEITLSGVTAPLPSDFGAGMDNLLFGVERKPLEEYDFEDFVRSNGFQPIGSGSGRPSFYTIDQNENVFRFNRVPDQSYPFIPIYFRVPDDIPLDQTGDNQTVWFSDNNAIIEAVVEKIYQYKEDPREFTQAQKVDALKGRFKRGVGGIGGGSQRLQLSRKAFK